MFVRGYAWVILLLLLAVTSPPGLFGQAVVGGSLTGAVTDAADAVIPGADVSLTNEATGVRFSTKTNEVGSYTFASLAPGRYTLSVQMEGFSPVSITGVTVTVAQFARTDVQMKVGAVTERIEVAAKVGVVETERPTLSSVINHTQITQLPFNGRYSLSGLIALAPGVQRGGRFAAGGTFTGGLNVVVDGAVNLDMQNGGPSEATPTFDSIEEFRFVTSTASAEYSHGSAQLIVVTRSGANELHGSAFWFNRNREFAAKYALDHRPKPPFNRNEFGGTLGGRIVKDKLFYFFSFEQLSRREWATSTQNMATAAMKRGDFTALTVINDPLADGVPFADNRIPSDRISSVGQFFMKYMRDPNLAGTGPAGTGVNFIGRNPTVQDSPRIGIKGDYHPTSKDMLSGGVKIFKDGPYLRSGGGPELYGNFTQGFDQRQVFGAYTKVLSPRMTNELRGAVTTPYGYHYTNTLSGEVDPGKIFPTLDGQCCAEKKSPDKDYVGRFGGGLPGVNMTGYRSIFTNGAHAKDNRLDINISDNLLYIRGPHQMKIGGYYYRYQGYWGGIYPHGLGIFDFTGRYTRDAFADFLLGFANQSTRGPAYQFGDFNEKRVGVFFQDDWQVGRKLTLNLGLRWDVETPFKEKKLRQANYVPALNALVTFSGNDQYPPEVVTRLVESYPVITSVKAGLGTTTLTRDTNWKNFQPRIGFAWRPFGDNRTVIRAGGGFYY
ncbi:MAG: TonB-dependent receptor, partial [Acidobacteriota bacterium]